MQPRAGLIDLLTYIVRQPIPKLKDEPDAGIKWSDNFKYFIECWYVTSALHCIKPVLINKQSRKRARTSCLSLAYARAPLDDRDARQAR